jgi:hypothetical protein
VLFLLLALTVLLLLTFALLDLRAKGGFHKHLRLERDFELFELSLN